MLLDLFCWMIPLRFKTSLLCPKNRERTWAKSIKLASVFKCRREKMKSFLNTLILRFFWQISSCNELNWYCSYALEDFKYLVATWKFKTFETTNLLLQLTKNYRLICSFCKLWSSFSNFLSVLTVFCPYLFRITSPTDFRSAKRSPIKNMNTKAAALIKIILKICHKKLLSSYQNNFNNAVLIRKQSGSNFDD